jgi:chromosome segregation ATPase
VRSIGIAVRATPLAATPLADEIAALRAEVVSLRAHQAAIEAALEPSSNIETTLGGRVKALRARVEELEAWYEHDGYRKDCESLTEAVKRRGAERDALRAQLLSERERLERWLTAPDGKQYERGTVQAVFDECDALRAQVEAARTYARQSLDYGDDCDAHDLLKAMDEAKP